MLNIEEGYSLEQHPEGEPRRLDAPVFRLDLARELAQLQDSEVWRITGRNAKTLVKYPDLRIVLIAMKTGVRLGEHQTIGRLSLQTLRGRVGVRLSGENVELAPGGLLALGPQIAHEVYAHEPSMLLLTIAWPPPAPHG